MTDAELIAAFERLELRLVEVEKKVSALGGGTKSTAGEIADDADLDGKYGNEPIKRDPSAKYWNGESFVGKNMNECTAEYLDAVAKYRDACAYMNEKSGDAEKSKYIGYDRKSARRARGWAKRLRDGYKPAVAEKSDDLFSAGGDNDDIPFS